VLVFIGFHCPHIHERQIAQKHLAQNNFPSQSKFWPAGRSVGADHRQATNARQEVKHCVPYQPVRLTWRECVCSLKKDDDTAQLKLFSTKWNPRNIVETWGDLYRMVRQNNIVWPLGPASQI
jgi:hypothetical protein